MMDIIEFGKKFNELKAKAVGVIGINVSNNESFLLRSIDVSYCPIQKRFKFHILYEKWKTGYAGTYGSLLFDLEEMDNDLDYFKQKYEDKKERQRLATLKRKEEEHMRNKAKKELEERAEYERLKSKFEGK